MIKRLIIFLTLNFGALALGGLFTSTGVSSEWYITLNKAPWTPPGWVFGAAWTSIMICYSVYLSILWAKVSNHKKLLALFITQLVLNISWNPLFFSLQLVSIAMIAIALLTIVVGYFLFYYRLKLQWESALLLPYFLWLLIASSLNGYILLNN